MGHTRRGLPSSFHCNSMYCYKHAEEEEEGEEKAAVRVKGERGRSRFTVTFSPILPKQQQPAVVVGGFFFGRHFMFLNGCHVYLAEFFFAAWEEHIRQNVFVAAPGKFYFSFPFLRER